jgi:hypothetical protein
MCQSQNSHQWTKKDRVRHSIPATPLILFYIGSIYLLAKESIELVALFLLLWVGVNLAVAGICVGCPYRGGYCPGLSQLYFAPLLSKILYPNRDQIRGLRSFKSELTLLGVLGLGHYVFTFYWLFRLYLQPSPLAVLLLLALLIVHMPLSFFIICPKGGYNDTCPMSRVSRTLQ